MADGALRADLVRTTHALDNVVLLTGWCCSPLSLHCYSGSLVIVWPSPSLLHPYFLSPSFLSPSCQLLWFSGFILACVYQPFLIDACKFRLLLSISINSHICILGDSCFNPLLNTAQLKVMITNMPSLMPSLFINVHFWILV